MSILLALILIAIAFLISAAIAVLLVGPLILLQPHRRKAEWYLQYTTLLQPSDAGLAQENIILTTPDGVALDCWFVPDGRRARGTIIYLHGVGDCKTSGVALAQLFHRHGYHVFLYDSRRHGNSGGAYCTYGYYEKLDVSLIISYLESRTDHAIGPVGLFGTSMGAAVAIQAAAIDPRVRCVVAEASFTDLRTITVDYQRRLIKLPWHFLRNVALSRAQRLARFKASEVSPLRDVAALHIPLLFLHGSDDSFVRYQYSKRLYDQANEPKDMLIVPRAHHTNVWEVGGKAYEESVMEFFDSALRPRKGTGRHGPQRKARK